MGANTIRKITLKSIVEYERNCYNFFTKLYKLVESDFRGISTSYHNYRDSREHYQYLFAFFFTRMKHIVGNIIKRKIIDETIEEIDEEDDTNLLCLSLFEAAAHYLVEYKIGTLKRLRPQHIDGFIITARPPNLIHESVKKAIRREEDYGKNLQGFAKEIFKYISVIKEADLERHGISLNFIRNGKIQQTCRHLQNRCQEKHFGRKEKRRTADL